MNYIVVVVTCEDTNIQSCLTVHVLNVKSLKRWISDESSVRIWTRSLWMKLCASRYSIPSHTSWHMDTSHASFRAPPLCRRKFSRQPFSMNSATISRGRCCRQTPYSCTSLGWQSLLQHTHTHTLSPPVSTRRKFPALAPSSPPSLHHDLGLLDEVLLQHGALSDGLDGHFVLRPPLAQPHQTELAAAQLLHEGQLPGVDLPLLWEGKQIRWGCSTLYWWGAGNAITRKMLIHLDFT